MRQTGVRDKALRIAWKCFRKIFGEGTATAFITRLREFDYMPMHPDCRQAAFVPKSLDPQIRRALAARIAGLYSTETDNPILEKETEHHEAAD
jgi:hypothetical protein